MAGEVQRQQRLLQDVLCFARRVAAGARQHLAQVTAQADADRVEEEPVGCRVAGKCGEEDRSKPGFEVVERQGLGAFPEQDEIRQSVAWSRTGHNPARARLPSRIHIGVSL